MMKLVISTKIVELGVIFKQGPTGGIPRNFLPVLAVAQDIFKRFRPWTLPEGGWYLPELNSWNWDDIEALQAELARTATPEPDSEVHPSETENPHEDHGQGSESPIRKSNGQKGTRLQLLGRKIWRAFAGKDSTKP
jgi:hypothetical protein